MGSKILARNKKSTQSVVDWVLITSQKKVRNVLPLAVPMRERRVQHPDSNTHRTHTQRVGRNHVARSIGYSIRQSITKMGE